MKAELLSERPRLPSLHASRRDGNEVDSASPDWRVSADIFETLSAKQLAGAGYVFNARKAVVVPFRPLSERRSADSQPWRLRESGQQELKVLRVERDIGIKAGDDIVLEVLCTSVPLVKGEDFGGEVPFGALWPTYEFDPRVRRCVLLDNVICAVCGSIADDDPPHWLDCLANDRMNCVLNE